MNRRDLFVLIAIAALWVAWPVIDRTLIKPLFPDSPQPAERAEPLPERVARPPVLEAPPEKTPPAAALRDQETPLPEPAEPAEPERRVRLENDQVVVETSSHGAAVTSVMLKHYREDNVADSDPVTLDFTESPALVYEELSGLGGDASFAVVARDGERSVTFERTTPAGLRMRRTLTLEEEGYLIRVEDTLHNESGQDLEVSGAVVRLGPMASLETGASTRGVAHLGVDTLSPGGDKVRYWGKQIPRYFRDAPSDEPLPRTLTRRPHDNPVEWVAAKNKYFVQILAPEGGGEWVEIVARRTVLPQEETNPSFRPKMQPLASAAARVGLTPMTLPAGGSAARTAGYYAGPKKYDELAGLSMRQSDVMEFGMWAPIGRILLRLLNVLHDRIWPHNYGLAIIFLTILIRIVFWPITHKSTESMKRMSALQPLMAALREKHKDNPQKQQQEIMALYKEHKVNPLGGCLPMLIQIPVFFALFVVLRSAIELRYASFLWIADLSEPEGLLAGVLPIPLNILPLLMTATTIWQQKLTPTAGDSQQQKMMAFMPLMMLFIFYNMAAGLVLYWTTNQCLMIAQQLMLRRKQSAQPPGGKTA